MTLLVVLLLVGVAWTLAVIPLMALALLRPPRMTDGRAILLLHRLSPADLGLEFSETSFRVRDEGIGKSLKIAAWWIPHPHASGKCAVLVHGYGDAKVGAIAWAPLLNSLGFSVLAIDLRAHGESEGKYSTGGFWERHDLNQVIDQLRAQQGDAVRQIVLLGVSLGAAVCAAAAVSRDDLSAVILESPFADYRRSTVYIADRLGAPRALFAHFALPVAQWIAQADFAEVAPLRTIPKIPTGVLMIQSGDDPFVPTADLAELRSAVAGRPPDLPSESWLLEGVHHVVGLAADPVGYRKRIEDFLAQALPKTVGICESPGL